MLLVGGEVGEKGRACGRSKPCGLDHLPWKFSFFLTHCGLIYIRMWLLLLYFIKKPKNHSAEEKARETIRNTRLFANHYLKLAQG